jgi:hypothetical protein
MDAMAFGASCFGRPKHHSLLLARVAAEQKKFTSTALRTLPRATTVTRDGQKLYKLCRVVARGYSMSEMVEMTV